MLRSIELNQKAIIRIGRRVAPDLDCLPCPVDA